MGRSCDVDLFCKLLRHCVGKRIEVLHDEQERVGSADHVLPVVERQSAGRLSVGGVAQIRLVVDDRQPVYRDALRDRLIARLGDRTARIIRSVAGDVDDATAGLPFRLDRKSVV